jgi:hypothetical protein
VLGSEDMRKAMDCESKFDVDSVVGEMIDDEEKGSEDLVFYTLRSETLSHKMQAILSKDCILSKDDVDLGQMVLQIEMITFKQCAEQS